MIAPGGGRRHRGATAQAAAFPWAPASTHFATHLACHCFHGPRDIISSRILEMITQPCHRLRLAPRAGLLSVTGGPPDVSACRAESNDGSHLSFAPRARRWQMGRQRSKEGGAHGSQRPTRSEDCLPPCMSGHVGRLCPFFHFVSSLVLLCLI
jgi:hypothetical protein